MSAREFVLRSRRVVIAGEPKPASVRIRGGRIAATEPGDGDRLQSRIRRLGARHPDLRIRDLSHAWSAIAIVGRQAGDVLARLGVYGATGDPRSVVPASSLRVADAEVALIGVEAAGEGLNTLRHGASLGAGSTGVLHGSLSSILADEDGQILEAHSVSAGLDYPGVGPEHAYLRDTGRASYVAISDRQALAAYGELSRLEGIIPALESSHAIAWLLENPGKSGFDVLCLSGRGDKDLAEVVEHTGGG